MKTRLFTKSAIIMAAAFSLASCSQEEELVNPNTNPNTNTKTGRTVFSAGGPTENGTRTTLDKDRIYRWQYSDQIWVNDGGTWIKSMDSELAPDNRTANFFFDRVMTADSYEVLYTGYNSTSATKVNIPASFVSFGHYDYKIGEHGDCGVATATRNDNGTYSFALLHKGSYLGLAPIKVDYLDKKYKWKKIEIVEANGKPIAGAFGFSKNGIDTTSVTSPSSIVTITVNEENVPYLQSYNSSINYVYAVMPPSYRTLSVKYYFYNAANPDEILTVTRNMKSRKFHENNVTQLQHLIMPEFYRWDAPRTEPFTEKYFNQSTADYFTAATNICATMPNPNELYWYIENGDPRWDETTEWTNDGGATYHTGGVWIKKKRYITGYDSTTGKNGVDMRTTYVRHDVETDTYRKAGKPADSEIDKYFFLPAMGDMSINGGGNLERIGNAGYYWSSGSVALDVYNQPAAYGLAFNNNSIYVIRYDRRLGLVAGNGSDWFK